MRSFILTACALVNAAIAADYRVTLGISQVTGQVGTGYDPNRILPVAGDTITFSWNIPSYINNPTTGSYSATQGSYGSPCQPMAGGFDSGPHTTAPESAGSATTMVFQVKDSQPLYFYSSVGQQCKQGMVLGVNSAATGDGSIESYITAAGGDPNANANTGNSSSTTTTTTPATPATTTPTNTTVKVNTTSSTSSTTKNSTPVNSTASADKTGLANGLVPQSAFLFLGLVASALVA